MRTPRLKPMLDAVPPGFIVDTPWLISRGINSKSIHNYVASGWLERVVRGVYRRPLPDGVDNDELSWKVLLLSLQRFTNSNAYLGGRSALDFTGHIHYLNMGEPWPIHLYGDAPSWTRRLPTSEAIVWHRSKLFFDDQLGIHTAEETESRYQRFVDVWRWPFRLASVERAILEAIDDLPFGLGFEHLDRIFEGLFTLRPKLLHQLLVSCTKIKTKRMFFVYADLHEHHWRKSLDASLYDLGRGPRSLVQGEKMHPKYQITVPNYLLPAQEEAVPYV